MLERFLTQKIDSSLDRVHLQNSLQLRCSQTPATVLLLTSIFAILLVVLEAPVTGILFWILPVSCLQFVRYRIVQEIKHQIESVNNETLLEYDLRLRVNSLLTQAMVGSGVWTVAIPGNPDTAIFVTLVICLFGLGAMTNLANDYLSFKLSIPVLLVQPVLYWAMQGKEGLSVWVPILAIYFLMMKAARRNQRIFTESISIRFDKERLLKQLEKEKRITESALHKAEQANRSKTFFMAAASHDLRQPLYAVSLFRDTLAMHELDEEIKQILEKQKKALDTVNHMFNNLLDLSRLEAGQISVTREKVNLEELLKDVASENQLVCQNKGINLNVLTRPLWVNSDLQLLYRLFSNLVSNAVRYTSKGQVTIRMVSDRGRHQVYIEDTGCGIPAECQEKIFNAFVQIDNPKGERSRGVGLGLAIVRHIAKLLDVQVNLEPGQDCGTCFRIEIPASQCFENASVARVTTS